MIKDQIEAAPHTLRNQGGRCSHTDGSCARDIHIQMASFQTLICVSRRQMKLATDKWVLAQGTPSRSAGILQLSDKNQAILVEVRNASVSLEEALSLLSFGCTALHHLTPLYLP